MGTGDRDGDLLVYSALGKAQHLLVIYTVTLTAAPKCPTVTCSSEIPMLGQDHPGSVGASQPVPERKGQRPICVAQGKSVLCRKGPPPLNLFASDFPVVFCSCCLIFF